MLHCPCANQATAQKRAQASLSQAKKEDGCEDAAAKYLMVIPHLPRSRVVDSRIFTKSWPLYLIYQWVKTRAAAPFKIWEHLKHNVTFWAFMSWEGRKYFCSFPFSVKMIAPPTHTLYFGFHFTHREADKTRPKQTTQEVLTSLSQGWGQGFLPTHKKQSWKVI